MCLSELQNLTEVMDNMTKQAEGTIETLAAIMEYNFSNPEAEISSSMLKDYKAALAGNRQLLVYLDAMRVNLNFGYSDV